MRRTMLIVPIVATLAACQPMPTVDPDKLERALRSMDKAADAVQDAIEDARDAAPLPEREDAMVGEPVQAEPLP